MFMVYINVLVRVLQSNSTSRIYIGIYRKSFIIEIDSCNYGSREVTVCDCKL